MVSKNSLSNEVRGVGNVFFALEKGIYNKFETYRKGFNYVFMILMIIGVLVILFFILSAVFDLQPLFEDRTKYHFVKTFFHNPNLDPLSYYGNSLDNVVVTTASKGALIEPNRRWFYNYSYKLVTIESGNDLVHDGRYEHYDENKVEGTFHDIVIPLSLVKELRNEYTFKLTLIRRIGYSNFNLSQTTSDLLDEENGEFITYVSKTETLINDEILPNGITAVYRQFNNSKS